MLHRMLTMCCELACLSMPQRHAWLWHEVVEMRDTHKRCSWLLCGGVSVGCVELGLPLRLGVVS